jgi:hypothetical protein
MGRGAGSGIVEGITVALCMIAWWLLPAASGGPLLARSRMLMLGGEHVACGGKGAGGGCGRRVEFPVALPPIFARGCCFMRLRGGGDAGGTRSTYYTWMGRVMRLDCAGGDDEDQAIKMVEVNKDGEEFVVWEPSKGEKFLSKMLEQCRELGVSGSLDGFKEEGEDEEEEEEEEEGEVVKPMFQTPGPKPQHPQHPQHPKSRMPKPDSLHESKQNILDAQTLNAKRPLHTSQTPQEGGFEAESPKKKEKKGKGMDEKEAGTKIGGDGDDGVGNDDDDDDDDDNEEESVTEVENSDVVDAAFEEYMERMLSPKAKELIDEAFVKIEERERRAAAVGAKTLKELDPEAAELEGTLTHEEAQRFGEEVQCSARNQTLDPEYYDLEPSTLTL